MEMPIYFQYWGKAKRVLEIDSADYHLLPYHCLDVAAVGMQLLSLERSLTRDLASFLALSTQQLRSMVSFILALHDIGKFASAFQKLLPGLAVGLHRPDCPKEYDGRYFCHDRIGLYFWENIKAELLNRLVNIEGAEHREQREMFDTLMVFIDCVLGHHAGQLIKQAIERLNILLNLIILMLPPSLHIIWLNYFNLSFPLKNYNPKSGEGDWNK